MTKKLTNNKTKALDLALGQIDKQFGKGSIMRLNKDRFKLNGRFSNADVRGCNLLVE